VRAKQELENSGFKFQYDNTLRRDLHIIGARPGVFKFQYDNTLSQFCFLLM
ncbi:hypothetical protein FPOG_02490, partial [Fusobacterium periodonticum D10]